ncbi:MAG: oxygenase [Sulfitobacter sp.]|nr:oxygenase [Sulfitobacter sp.]
MAERGLLPVAETQPERFLGKVLDDTARCRGGDHAAKYRDTPWVDWSNYWATGDDTSRSGNRHPLTFITKHLERNGRGVDGALMDLERQRVELIKFNLFDNYTYTEYVLGRDGQDGRTIKSWPEMRLPPGHPDYGKVGGEGVQVCRGEMIRFRNLDGTCNDMRNPAMGSTGMSYPRNVAFEATFPIEAAKLGDTVVENRHGGRIDALTPDPQVISRKLFTRPQKRPELCNAGYGLPDNDVTAQCDYTPAPFFNVLAAYWIQFMTHDWFSHLQEGRNNLDLKIPMGCETTGVGDAKRDLTSEEVKRLKCNPKAREYAALFAETDPPARFDGGSRLSRAYKTTPSTVTAWWDASQIYGYDDVSRARVKIDPSDPAKLLLRPVPAREEAGDTAGYLSLLHLECAAADATCEVSPMNPKWNGQEAVAFPENWSIGMSFFHNLFAREHNSFVDAFRAHAAKDPNADSGLRRPQAPQEVVTYEDIEPEELFEITRLVVAAMIAKIHTIEWTTQLLYDEPLYTAMNSNWYGLAHDYPRIDDVLHEIVMDLGHDGDAEHETTWYSVFSSGAGIVGTGTVNAEGDIATLDYVNAGVNHFGSPFNLPEEFVSVYRLHPLLPDLIEVREPARPNTIAGKLPIVTTFRHKATDAMHKHGLESIALSFGRQRLGALALQNQPRFLQSLMMPSRPEGDTKVIDVTALDIIRDRERGIPRFNEFRRQIGLRQLTSFNDFVDKRLKDKGDRTKEEEATLKQQEALVLLLREVYGQHKCDKNKIISTVQHSPDSAAGGTGQSPFPNDCLGHDNGTMVDNVEDLDTIVGYLAESTRPHGFAISETQFQIFIINASRRLFSDRFFTSSFRPEFYSTFGLDWVKNNGPDKRMEKGKVNGHRIEVLPLKRILMRNLPGLRDQLEPVKNAFDPWARARGEYFDTSWKPIPSAKRDPAFLGQD